MDGNYYFISDIHLGLKDSNTEKEKERSLVRFFDKYSVDAKKIFIVGDLFDCWIEYNKVVPKGYFRLFSKINELVEGGLEINFLSGNHDFWLNHYLRDEVGMKIYYNELTETLNGKKFYMIHGDGLSGKDLGYKILKKILRSRINQKLYSWIHPDIGMTLAQRSSKKSRDFTNDKQTGFPDFMLDYAINKIHEGFDYVVMGHFHKPVIQKIKADTRSGYFVTLGDWIKFRSYGHFNDNNFTLNFWEKNNQ